MGRGPSCRVTLEIGPNETTDRWCHTHQAWVPDSGVCEITGRVPSSCEYDAEPHAHSGAACVYPPTSGRSLSSTINGAESGDCHG